MSNNLPFALTLIAVLCFAPALDAETAKPAPLSLADCVALAQQRQVKVLSGQQTVVADKAMVTQKLSTYYPQVGIVENLFLMGSRQTGGAGNGASIEVTQSFYDGGAREANLRGTRARVTGDTAGLARTRQNVTNQITKDYFAYLLAQRKVDVDKASVKALEEQLATVQGQVAAGAAAKSDELPIEAKLAAAKVTVLADQNNVATSSIVLQNDIGLTPMPDFAVQDFAAPTALTMKSLDESMKAALHNRPDLMQTQASVTSAQATVDADKIVLRPYPTIGGAMNQPLFGHNKNSFSVTGGITYDIFDAKSNLAAYHAAKANLAIAQLNAAQIDKDIQADVQKAYLTVTSAQEQLAANDLSLKASQSNYDVQVSKYKLGMAVPLDLLNAQTDVANAQNAAIQARYSYYQAIADLEYATGAQQSVLHY